MYRVWCYGTVVMIYIYSTVCTVTVVAATASTVVGVMRSIEHTSTWAATPRGYSSIVKRKGLCWRGGVGSGGVVEHDVVYFCQTSRR